MQQATIFDEIAARQLAEAGLAKACKDRPGMVVLVKQVAIEVGRRLRHLTADDVRAELCTRGFTDAELSKALGNAAGSMFKQHGFRITERSVKSRREASHSRRLPVWEYIGQ